MFNFFRRLWMKFTRVPGPLRNAQRYRDKGVKVGRGTYIYRTCTISTSVCDDITIGSGCVLTGCAILAHDASLKRHIGRVIACPVVIGDNCFIGFNSTILKGVKIGDNSIIGAGAVVTKDIPANSVAAGNPARVICSVEQLAAKYRAE